MKIFFLGARFFLVDDADDNADDDFDDFDDLLFGDFDFDLGVAAFAFLDFVAGFVAGFVFDLGGVSVDFFTGPACA